MRCLSWHARQYVIPPPKQLQPSTFQHAGALPHWSKNVWTSFDETFPDIRIGHCGPVSWLPRSPNIFLLLFFLRRHAKDYIYRISRDDIATLSCIDNHRFMKYGIRNVDSYMNRTVHFHLFWLSFTKTFQIGKGQRIIAGTVEAQLAGNIATRCYRGWYSKRYTQVLE